ncbi:hypothetical protein MHYP_G00208560 [Metynnis hypsauchen]
MDSDIDEYNNRNGLPTSYCIDNNISGLLDEDMPDASYPPPVFVEGESVNAVCRLLDSRRPVGGLQYLGRCSDRNRGVGYRWRICWIQLCCPVLPAVISEAVPSSSP